MPLLITDSIKSNDHEPIVITITNLDVVMNRTFTLHIDSYYSLKADTCCNPCTAQPRKRGV